MTDQQRWHFGGTVENNRFYFQHEPVRWPQFLTVSNPVLLFRSGEPIVLVYEIFAEVRGKKLISECLQ